MENEEIINITKIKDGLYLGDETTANNLNNIIKFKITSMINAAGNQIMNAWESIGIKYLTLKWSDNPSQNLFDNKTDIAYNIVKSIDDADELGEGILIHSAEGKNRACVVVIIYFMKKYNWSLKKSLEFLKHKKADVEIRNYFLNQLDFFERNLKEKHNRPMSHDWTDSTGLIKENEIILRNTYLNGIVNQANYIRAKVNFSRPLTSNSLSTTKIKWADGNRLYSALPGKELIMQKQISKISSQVNKRPIKSCIKLKNNRTNGIEPKRSSSLAPSQIKTFDQAMLKNEYYSIQKNDLHNIKQIIHKPKDNFENRNFYNNNYSLDVNKHKDFSAMSSKEVKMPYNNDEVRQSKENFIKNDKINGSYSISKLNNEIAKDNLKLERVNSRDKIDLQKVDSIKNIKSTYDTRISQTPSETNLRKNNFVENKITKETPDNISVLRRCYSVDQKNKTEKIYYAPTKSPDNTTQIIYASKYENIIHNNYNNTYIQPKVIYDRSNIDNSSSNNLNPERSQIFTKEQSKKENINNFNNSQYIHHSQNPYLVNKNEEKNNYAMVNYSKYNDSNKLKSNYQPSDSKYKQMNVEDSDILNKDTFYKTFNARSIVLKNPEYDNTMNKNNNYVKSSNDFSSSETKQYKNPKNEYYDTKPHTYDRNNNENKSKLNPNPNNNKSINSPANNYQQDTNTKVNNFNRTNQTNYTSQFRGVNQNKEPIKIQNEYENKPVTPDRFALSTSYNNLSNPKHNLRDNDRDNLYNRENRLIKSSNNFREHEKSSEKRYEEISRSRPKTPLQIERDSRINDMRISSVNSNNYLSDSNWAKKSISAVNSNYRGISPANLTRSSQYTINALK